MLISCPSCAAAYEVPDHLLSDGGQMLRCARCEREWMVMAIVAPSMPQPTAQPEPHHIVVADLTPPPEKRANLVLAVGAWVLSLVVIFALGWAALRWRDSVMAAWPATAPAYQAIGAK